MKCLQCIEQGLRSSVWLKNSFYGNLNELGEIDIKESDKFWDEDGEWHVHDSNPLNKDYECTNGHKWNTKEYSKCWCIWKRDEDEI